MNKDIGRYSIHINRHYLSNFALGIDYYQLIDSKTRVLEASILQLNFLFFNITFTRWHKWI
jgi:hypothetical protein